VRLEATGAEGTALRVAVPRAPLQLRCSVFLAEALPGEEEEDAEGPEVALEAVLRLMVWDLEGARSDPRVRGFQASGALAGATAGRGDGRVRTVVDIVQELPFRQGLFRGGGTAAGMAALPAACAARLRKHQWATLAWMLGEERSPWGLARHAWWQIPAAHDVQAARADGCVFYGPLVRRFRRTLPRGDGWRAGGVVADVGGSGKTAVVAALVASAGPGPQPPGRGRSRNTLVVTTVNSVATWKMELEAAGASVLVSKKKKKKKKEEEEEEAGEDPLARCDCVVAAYAQVERDAALGARPWHRVVFDSTTSGEGGGVCLRGGTPPFEALCRLDARRRWCLTSDLVPAHDREPLRHLARAIDGHLRLVGVSPAIRERVVRAAERRAAGGGDRAHATEAGDLDLLLGALRPLCTRYTGWGADRDAAASSGVGVGVAEAAEEWLEPDCDLAVTLSGDESARAHALEAECAAACAEAFPPWPAPPVAPGLKRLQAHATSLRRALGGGRYAAPPPATLGGGASTKEQPPDEEICAICRDELERPMQTPCGHWFCSECILTCLQVIVPPREDAADGHARGAGSSLPPAKKARQGDRMVGRCPLCRSRVAERELKASVAPGDRAGRRSDAGEGGGGGGGEPGVDDPVVFASKARALVRDIVDREAGRAESRGRPAKIVVVSQFHECLAWARREGLRDLGDFRVFHVERSMTLARRVEALAAWQRSGEASLLLVTAKSALSGVDLAGVTCCYFMEPCLSRHLERQLIARVRAVTAHVVGLNDPDLGACLVKRLVTVGTVEERLADAGFPEGADTRQVMRALFPPAAGGSAP